MTRKFGAKHSIAQKRSIDYYRRAHLVKAGKASWLRWYSVGADAAAEKAGL